jgi:hypothetical protein
VVGPQKSLLLSLNLRILIAAEEVRLHVNHKGEARQQIRQCGSNQAREQKKRDGFKRVILWLPPDLASKVEHYAFTEMIPNSVAVEMIVKKNISHEGILDDKERKNVGLIGPFVQNNINNYFLDFVYQNIDRFDTRTDFIVIGQCDYDSLNGPI